MNAVEIWATQRLSHETVTGFAHALKIDGMVSRSTVYAFKALPPEEQRLLVPFLSTGLLFAYFRNDQVVKTLSPEVQASLTHLAEEGPKQLNYGVPGEARDWSLFVSSHRQEARHVAKALIKAAKAEARLRGYGVSVVEPLVFWALRVVGKRKWCLEFDALRPFTVSCPIARMEVVGVPGRGPTEIPGQRMIYLAQLGLGPDQWCCRTTEEVPAVVAKVFDFREWHLAEMDKLET